MNIKELIKKIKKKGMTDADIAAATKVSVKTVNNWENEVFAPRVGKLRKLQELANDDVAFVEPIMPAEANIINQALLRTILYEMAEIKALLQKRPFEDVLKEVNTDNLEALNDLLLTPRRKK